MKRRTIEKAVGDDRFSIHAGAGYFYFTLDDGDRFVDSAITGHSVYVPRLSDLSLDQWVSEARDFIEVARAECKRQRKD